MKRIYAILCFFVLYMSTAVAQSGYPYTQVPFTAVKITPNTFWGDRVQAAREVTIPLALSKCEIEHRYKNFEMAAYTLQHPGHPGLQTPEWDVAKFMGTGSLYFTGWQAHRQGCHREAHPLLCLEPSWCR